MPQLYLNTRDLKGIMEESYKKQIQELELVIKQKDSRINNLRELWNAQMSINRMLRTEICDLRSKLYGKENVEPMTPAKLLFDDF